jgi:hypothetical protein
MWLESTARETTMRDDLIKARRKYQAAGRRLDIVRFEVEAPTREEAIELARQQIDSPERADAWIEGEPHLRDSGFIITPGETPWA